MADQEEKVKIVKCRLCGNLYNKYTRPWGSRLVCSDICQISHAEQLQAETKKNLKSWWKWELIGGLCFCLFAIVAILIILWMIWNAAWSPY